jgi:hypothetical protein
MIFKNTKSPRDFTLATIERLNRLYKAKELKGGRTLRTPFKRTILNLENYQ